MKTSISSVRQRGSVLVITLVIALLVGIVVASLLFVAQQQNYLTARSRAWCSEIPIAEAGIEEALTHITSRPVSLAQNGWTASGTNYVKTRSFSNAYFHTTIIPTSAATNTIISVGFARIPLQTNYSQRTVMAMVKQVQTDWGFVAKRTIVMSGTTYADSYISSDTNYSTANRYDPSKRRDNCGMASISSLTPAISTGSGKIYGNAATGPGGTVTGNVGDGSWLFSGSGLQPGHVTDDFNMAIPDVTLPSPWKPWFAPVRNQMFNGVLYEYVLPSGDWQFNGSASPRGNGWLVQGKVRIFFNGDFKMTSSGTALTLAPGATLEIYLGGNMDLTGQCVINPTGITGNCLIYGLNTCKSIKYAGSAEAYARIYAPYAAVEISGGFDFSGSVVSDTMKFSGRCALHYDEAMHKGVPQFRVVSWEEL